MAVWSMKIDQERYDAFTLLAEQRGTTKNALMVEAVDILLDGGMKKVLDERLDACVERFFGGNTLDGVVENRLRQIVGEMVSGILLKTEKPKSQSQAINQTQEVNIPEALKTLEGLLEGGSDVALDDLANVLGIQDKGLLSRSLSALGIKTERKRVAGGQRKQMYEQAILVQVKKAITG